MEPFELLSLLARKLDELRIGYFVTGSMATIAYGKPRFTNDIDIVITLQPAVVKQFGEAFPSSDFNVSEDAVRTAIRNRRHFNIIHPSSGLNIDCIIPKDEDFKRSRQVRTVRLPVAQGVDVPFASPEDVIIRKMQYYQDGGSDKHLRNIAGMLKVLGERSDRPYIVNWADRFAVRDFWDLILKQMSERA